MIASASSRILELVGGCGKVGRRYGSRLNPNEFGTLLFQTQDRKYGMISVSDFSPLGGLLS
jgi:hypothetical protein